MVRKDFSQCFVNVYIPEITLKALAARLNDANDHWDKSRSAYIVKAINALLISEGYMLPEPATQPAPAREPETQTTCSNELAPE